MRLIYADWLAHCDRPPSRRPAMVTTASGYEFYPPAHDAPRVLRSFGPAELDAWLESSVFVRIYRPFIRGLQGAFDGDRQKLATLQLALALALYEWEHGGPPKKLEELVGPYLEQLPEGYREVEGEEEGEGR